MRGLVFLKVKVRGQNERQYIDAKIVTPRDVELAFAEDEIQRERERQYAERIVARLNDAKRERSFDLRLADLASNYNSLMSGLVH